MSDQPPTGGGKRALLIGCPVGSLRGVETDLRVIESVLREFGFTNTKCYPATKAEIIAAWNKLIEETRQADAVVIYYSGHGGIAERRGGCQDGKTRLRLQYLVPIDFNETTADDWRGISDIELSKLLHRTTEKTENVTLILDCCHSARIARRPGIVKAIDPNDYHEVLRHIKNMMDDGKLDMHFYLERNPLAICVVGAPQTESAYERDFYGDDGTTRMSVLTEALEKALRQKTREGPKYVQVSWRSIMFRIRDRMKITCPQQYPQVEGDDLRLAFSLRRADLHDAISTSRVGDSVILNGGHIHGLNAGDIYALLPFGEERLDPDKQIAEVVVTNVGPAASQARFEGNTRPPLIGGVVAFLKKKALRRLPIVLEGPEDFVAKFRSAIDSSRLVRAADENDQLLLATIRQKNSRISLQGHEGNMRCLLGDWQIQDGENQNPKIADCVARLESLARSRHVLTLQGNKDFSQQVNMELGLVKDGNRHPFAEEIVAIHAGERLYVRVCNTGSSTVYVWIFLICADSVSLLSDLTPEGRDLHPGGSYTYGELDLIGNLAGSEVMWPEGIPKGASIPETFVLVVADGKIDLRGLETDSRRRRGRLETSELIEPMDDIAASGRLRTLPRESQQPKFFQYWVSRFFLQLEAPSSSSESLERGDAAIPIPEYPRVSELIEL